MAAVAAEHFQATHHCRAQRILFPEAETPLELSSDAGEPAGTAGRPIRRLLSGAGIVNAVLVVSRWFGGTKLGRGGLARAYADAARAAVSAARLAPLAWLRRLAVRAPFGDAGAVAAAVGRLGARVESVAGAGEYRAILLAPEARWSDLARAGRGDGRTGANRAPRAGAPIGRGGRPPERLTGHGPRGKLVA